MRVGRSIRFDPAAERIPADDEAGRPARPHLPEGPLGGSRRGMSRLRAGSGAMVSMNAVSSRVSRSDRTARSSTMWVPVAGSGEGLHTHFQREPEYDLGRADPQTVGDFPNPRMKQARAIGRQEREALVDDPVGRGRSPGPGSPIPGRRNTGSAPPWA